MSITITAEVMENVNYAAIHVGVPLIRNISVTGEVPKGSVCRVYSEPAFFFEYRMEMEEGADNLHIELPEIHLDDGFYRKECIEAQEGTVKIEIVDSENPQNIIGFKDFPVHVQPYLHWDAMKYAGTLPAFMQPNDPLIAKVLKSAGKYAAQMGISMFGYQGSSRDTVVKQAECIYRALQDANLHYISSPASFERAGQKIRIPHQVLHEDSGQGTCLDLAILYASCLEAASLFSMLILIPGHAFAGVWLESSRSLNRSMMVRGEITEEVWSVIESDMLPVECTTFTDGRDISFQSATEVGKKNTPEYEYFIDVEKARREGIGPVYTFTDKPICEVPDPDEETETVDMSASDMTNFKYELYRKQAMDTSGSNRLLNRKNGAGEISFQIPAEAFFSEEWTEEKPYLIMRNDVLDQGETEEGLEQKLHKMWLNERDMIRERGQGSLYLGISELVWYPEEKKKHRAVLYLCPAEIFRNRRGEYLFRVKKDGVRLNPVLRVMLKKDFGIDIDDLPDDPSGSYGEVVEKLRYRIEKKKKWVVKEDSSCLASFTIPNGSIWRALSDERVFHHEIVQGILSETMSWKDENADEEERGESVYAFQADSSQAETVNSSFKKKAQVVIGPAGNGKTQTIANIIADGILRGEKVLFVSEKPAALSVVADKMKELSMKPFCLDIISGVHSFSDVSGRIRDTLRYMESYESEEVYDSEGSLQEYRKAGEKIRNYYELMCRKGKGGKSQEELYRMYERYRTCPMKLEWNGTEMPDSMDDGERIIDDMLETMRYNGYASDRYSQYLKYPDTPEKMEEAERCVKSVLDLGNKMWEKVEKLDSLLNLSEGKGQKTRIKRMIEIASVLRSCPELGKEFKPIEKEQNEDLRGEMLELLEEMQGFRSIFRRTNTYREDLREILGKIVGLSAANSYLLRPYEELKEIIRSLDLSGYQEELSTAEENQQEKYREFTRKKENSEFKNWTPDEKDAFEWAEERILHGNGSEVRNDCLELINIFKDYNKEQKKAEKLVLKNLEEFEQKYPKASRMLLYEAWDKSRNSNSDQKIYQEMWSRAENAGLEDIVQQIEEKKRDKKIEDRTVLQAFRKCWCDYQIHAIQDEIPELKHFNYVDYLQNVKQYRKEEKKLRRGLRRKILECQLDRLPDFREGVFNSSEYGNLQKIVRNKKKTTTRMVFEQSPNALMELYPCMIMNPAAVAEYIPMDFPQFDMVIIDEGSQLPAYKGVIAIAHGKRCLIFGDEMQLMPTRFFEKMMEDEEGDATQVESILAAAIITNMPRKMLKYHYRSENESLIAFSNDRYYHNDIITFPSYSTSVKGVSYEFVEDGCYDRGKTKTNAKEALRVVKKVHEIYEGLPEDTKETLGIITMNLNQKNLIQNQLLKDSMEDQNFGRKADELISVVNLEVCQGREWDHVILSPVYGMDSDGNFTMNLGALSQDGGSNRLNVMITRAKKYMYVITSLTPEMLSEAKSGGVRDLKDYLSYARGDYSYDKRSKKEENNRGGTSLAEGIAEALREKGYTVHTNIGSSRCRVDLGIVSSNDPNRYALGILLDHFQTSGSAVRDREVIYPEALRRKGWTIYRLHSLNWYSNMESEIRQIQSRVKEAEEK